MMKKLILQSAVSIMFLLTLFSCTKEQDLSNSNSGSDRTFKLNYSVEGAGLTYSAFVETREMTVMDLEVMFFDLSESLIATNSLKPSTGGSIVSIYPEDITVDQVGSLLVIANKNNSGGISEDYGYEIGDTKSDIMAKLHTKPLSSNNPMVTHKDVPLMMIGEGVKEISNVFSVILKRIVTRVDLEVSDELYELGHLEYVRLVRVIDRGYLFNTASFSAEEASLLNETWRKPRDSKGVYSDRVMTAQMYAYPHATLENTDFTRIQFVFRFKEANKRAIYCVPLVNDAVLDMKRGTLYKVILKKLDSSKGTNSGLPESEGSNTNTTIEDSGVTYEYETWESGSNAGGEITDGAYVSTNNINCAVGGIKDYVFTTRVVGSYDQASFTTISFNTPVDWVTINKMPSTTVDLAAGLHRYSITVNPISQGSFRHTTLTLDVKDRFGKNPKTFAISLHQSGSSDSDGSKFKVSAMKGSKNGSAYEPFSSSEWASITEFTQWYNGVTTDGVPRPYGANKINGLPSNKRGMHFNIASHYGVAWKFTLASTTAPYKWRIYPSSPETEQNILINGISFPEFQANIDGDNGAGTYPANVVISARRGIDIDPNIPTSHLRGPWSGGITIVLTQSNKEHSFYIPIFQTGVIGAVTVADAVAVNSAVDKAAIAAGYAGYRTTSGFWYYYEVAKLNILGKDKYILDRNVGATSNGFYSNANIPALRGDESARGGLYTKDNALGSSMVCPPGYVPSNGSFTEIGKDTYEIYSLRRNMIFNETKGGYKNCYYTPTIDGKIIYWPIAGDSKSMITSKGNYIINSTSIITLDGSTPLVLSIAATADTGYSLRCIQE